MGREAPYPRPFKGSIGVGVHLLKDTSFHLCLWHTGDEVFGDMGDEVYTTDDTFMIESDFRKTRDGKGIHVGFPPPNDSWARGPWMDLNIKELEEYFGAKAVRIVEDYGCLFLTDMNF